jgi:hypothetical protein
MGYPRFGMLDLLKLLGGLFRSRAAREAETAFLRQQLVVLKRSAPARLRLRTADRLIFVRLYRLFPSLLEAAVVFKPETLVCWHRSGLRLYWRWKSRRRVGRPAVPVDIRDLIGTISRDNPLWGAPRIHGELLKLGIDIAQSTVAKYMSRRHGPGSPGWRAFLRNHTAHIAGVDLFVVPTIGFKLLYGLVILRLERRRLVWAGVTANPNRRVDRPADHRSIPNWAADMPQLMRFAAHWSEYALYALLLVQSIGHVRQAGVDSGL